MQQLDIELDNGEWVILSITRRGYLSVLCFKDCSRGRSMFGLAGSKLVARESLTEWVHTLCEARGAETSRLRLPQPGKAKHEASKAIPVGMNGLTVWLLCVIGVMVTLGHPGIVI
jgi:hypothetical protein